MEWMGSCELLGDEIMNKDGNFGPAICGLVYGSVLGLSQEQVSQRNIHGRTITTRPWSILISPPRACFGHHSRCKSGKGLVHDFPELKTSELDLNPDKFICMLKSQQVPNEHQCALLLQLLSCCKCFRVESRLLP